MIEGMLTTMDILSRSLNAESLRKKVIANNLANAETPYFKRSDVNFEKELFRAIKSKESLNNPFPARLLHEKHIPFGQVQDYKTVQPKVFVDYQSSYHNDLNNVDPEKEIVAWAKSNERYEAMTSILDRYFRKIRDLLR